MYISLKWLQNIIDLKKIPLEILCERLTLAGFEIEEIIQKKIENELDFILDISLTANRSDIFNIKTFTREIQSIFFEDKRLKKSKSSDYNLVKNSAITVKRFYTSNLVWENFLQKNNFYYPKSYEADTVPFDSCFTFLSFSIDTVKVHSSPPWLKKCLGSSNLELKNNIEDTLQFLCLEIGYSFFCFDLSKLENYLNTSSFSFSVRKASLNQKLKIDSVTTISLDSNNLLLYANTTPISILGLLTLKDIEVSENTTKILIYSGIFDSVKIRKSSQVLGIRTERSVSLEKSLNTNGLEQAYIRLSFLLKAQGIRLKTSTIPEIHHLSHQNNGSFLNYVENRRPKLQLRYKEIETVLGSFSVLRKEKILTVLKSLYFNILEHNEEACELYVPFSRELDIEREVDLIEEIVRINGFTNFNSSTPKIKSFGKLSKQEKLKRLLRRILIEKGLNEVLHYSICSLSTPQQLELKNPIVPESSFFRTSLIPQLIQKAALNTKQKNNVFEAFEFARVYRVSNGKVFESELVGGIFGGTFYHSIWNEEGKTINWFEAKGLMNYIFEALDVRLTWEKSIDHTSMHPGRTALLLINNINLGVFGQIHPILAKKNGLSATTFLFELNLDILTKQWLTSQIRKYKPYSLFPASLVDLACIKKDEISFYDVIKRIRDVGGSILESIEVFDYYAGVPIANGYHSIGFKLKFRNSSRTLTNNEVEEITKKITKSLEDNFKIQIRK